MMTQASGIIFLQTLWLGIVDGGIGDVKIWRPPDGAVYQGQKSNVMTYSTCKTKCENKGMRVPVFECKAEYLWFMEKAFPSTSWSWDGNKWFNQGFWTDYKKKFNPTRYVSSDGYKLADWMPTSDFIGAMNDAHTVVAAQRTTDAECSVNDLPPAAKLACFCKDKTKPKVCPTASEVHSLIKKCTKNNKLTTVITTAATPTPAAAETTTTAAAETTTPAAQETTTSAVAETTPAITAETTTPTVAETTPPAAAEITTAAAAEKTTPAAQETTTSAVAETTPAIAAETMTPTVAETTPPAAAEITTPAAVVATTPVAVDITTAAAAEITTPSAADTTDEDGSENPVAATTEQSSGDQMSSGSSPIIVAVEGNRCTGQRLRIGGCWDICIVALMTMCTILILLLSTGLIMYAIKQREIINEHKPFHLLD